MNLMYAVIPEPSPAELDEYLERAIHEAFSHGVTQVNDMSSYGGWRDMATYRRAYANHPLDLRIYSFVPIATWARLDSFIKENGRGDDILHWGGLKGFVDGSLGSTTAWFYKPYLDAPNTTGLQVSVTCNPVVLDAPNTTGLQVTDTCNPVVFGASRYGL